MSTDSLMNESTPSIPSSLITDGVIPGAVSGIVGGIVFGMAMLELGNLPSFASLVRLESPIAGYIVHMAIAATVGAGLGIVVWHQKPGIGEMLYWGVVYGIFWWFIGTLTLAPLILFEQVTWSADVAQSAFPALLGHVLYGATAGLTIAFIKSRRDKRDNEGNQISFSTLFKGCLAGLIAASIMGAILGAQGQLHTFAGRPSGDSQLVIWVVLLIVGSLVGIGFSLLHPRTTESSGAGIIRGATFGFLACIVFPLSLLPLLNGTVLPWSLNEVRQIYPALPAYLLFGAAMALFYQWLSGLMRLFFADVSLDSGDEAVGTQGLRAVGRGMAAGVVGGLIFGGVMLQIGALTNVASLIRVSSPIAGFFVHMLIAIIIGTTFGLLFRRQSYDIASALGWGASYGFIWWMLGPLTLFPTFLGITPLWSAEAVAQTFPNLVGHLLYGAGLGITLHVLEARYNPWWIPRRQAQAERVARRREQVLTSAPALWTFVVVVSLTLSVLLGTEAIPGLPGTY